MNNFEAQIKEKTNYIQNIIYEYCPKEEGLQKIIFEAMNYSIQAGGKRLRPMLILETLRLFNGDEEKAYPFMAAIEMIHTYSLVHDDLPAMDNDDFRRGRQTTHRVYGEDIGILAGDALLNYAYEIMCQGILKSDDMKNSVEAMNYIAGKAGVYGMVGGQVVDVVNEGKKIDIDTINFIHELKTAALIEASMVSGAILAGASEKEIGIIEKIAGNIGIAFQIQDDILDVTGKEDILGKPVLSDIKNEKDTFVSVMGIEKSKEFVEMYSNQAIDLLNNLPYDNEFLNQLIIKLIHREK